LKYAGSKQRLYLLSPILRGKKAHFRGRVARRRLLACSLLDFFESWWTLVLKKPTSQSNMKNMKHFFSTLLMRASR
jgi:hypothetical protein